MEKTDRSTTKVRVRQPGRTIVMTGSSGMLGLDLSRELSHDYVLCGIDITPNRTSAIHTFSRCNITDARRVIEVISRKSPDIVIHTAAWTDVDGCELNAKKAYQINAEGAKNVALACKRIDAALIYISTDFVFDGKKKTPYKETDKPNPLSVYGDSKLAGEEVIRSIVKEYYIIRTSWLYGKNGKNFVDTIIGKAKSEKLLKVVDNQVGSPTYTKDLAKAIHVLLGVISSGKGQGIYHVSNSGRVSWYAYAKEIVRLAGVKVRIEPISSKELRRPAPRPGMSVLDNAKFKRFTGYKMRPWQAALEEYITKKGE